MSLNKIRRMEILNIEDPLSFWIANNVKSSAFLRLVHEEISKSISILNLDNGQNELIAVMKQNDQMFYRAQILTIQSPYIFCFLVDTGETISARLANCKRIVNQKIHQLAPLAKYCKLYGIAPEDLISTDYNFEYNKK